MQQFLPLASLLFAAFLIVFGNGVAGLLLPARAAAEGWGADVVAIMGASYALAFTLACVLVPRLVGRVGHIRAFAVLGVLIISAMLLHAMQPTAWFWVLVRGMAGFAIAGAYMIIESWIGEETTSSNRGLAFSIYMGVSMGGYALGPFLVSAGDVRHFELFAWCAMIYAVATLPVLLTTVRAPAPLTTFQLDLRALYRNSPASFVGSLLTGLVIGAWLTLFPVWGLSAGLGTAAIAVILGVANVGAMVLQVPLGRLSDRIDRRIVMVGTGTLGAALGFAASVLPPSGWLFAAVMFVYGVTVFGTYSLNAAHANDWAGNVSFVTVASGLLILYGTGTVIGPLVAARAMAVVGPGGLFAFLAVCHALYAAFALWRITQRADAPLDEQTEFQTMPIVRVSTPQTFALDPRAEEGGADAWDEVNYAVAGEA